MPSRPAGFRYIDVHTHLHPPWLSAAIRRWFVGRPGWEFQYGTEPEILFGSDFPSTPHAYDEERRPIWERPVPDTVHRKIFYDNAKRLLDL